jgi:DNA-binding beta-propeller fold protein YncE
LSRGPGLFGILGVVRLPLIALGLVLSAASAAASPHYSVLVVEEMLGRVTLLDAADPARRVSVPVGVKPHEIAVAPDGRTAYVSNFGLNDADNREGTPGTSVSIIDVAAARRRGDLELPDGLKAPHGLAFRPRHPGELYVNAEQGDRLVVFDTAHRRVTRTVPLPAGVHNFVFSGDGAILFAFAPDGAVFRIDPGSGTVLARHGFETPVRGLAWSADGTRFIAALKGAIALLDPADLAVAQRFPLAAGSQPFYCAASPDGRVILVPAVFDASVTVLDARSGAVLRTLGATTPLRVLWSPDPDVAYVANVSPKGHSLTVVHLPAFETTEIDGLRDANGLAFSPVLPAAFLR